MTNFLFYFCSILLGFFPYYKNIEWLQIVYTVLLSGYSILFLASMIMVFIVKDINSINNVLRLNIPSKPFQLIFILFMGGTAAIYDHFYICGMLVFMGFSWSMILDLQKICGVGK